MIPFCSTPKLSSMTASSTVIRGQYKWLSKTRFSKPSQSARCLKRPWWIRWYLAILDSFLNLYPRVTSFQKKTRLFHKSKLSSNWFRLSQTLRTYSNMSHERSSSSWTRHESIQPTKWISKRIQRKLKWKAQGLYLNRQAKCLMTWRVYPVTKLCLFHKCRFNNRVQKLSRFPKKSRNKNPCQSQYDNKKEYSLSFWAKGSLRLTRVWRTKIPNHSFSSRKNLTKFQCSNPCQACRWTGTKFQTVA